jgi:hypothetical protein
VRAKRFIYVELLVFLGLVAATTLALRPVRAHLASTLRETELSLIGAAERAAGKQIRYQSAGLSLFNTFDIRGVELRDSENAASEAGAAEGGAAATLPDVSVERVRVAYSLPALLAGEGLKTIRRVTLDKPRVALTIPAKPDGTRPPAFVYSRFYTAFSGFFGDGFELVVRDGSLNASFGGTGTAGLDRVHAVFKKNRLITLEGRLRGDVRGTLSGGAVAASSPVRFQASFTPQSAAIRLSALALKTDFMALQKTDVLVTVSDHGITARKINDRRPFDLFVSYKPEGGVYHAAFSAKDFTPSELAAFRGQKLRRYEWALWSHLSGSLTVDGAAATAPRYRADLSGALSASSPLGYSRFSLAASGDTKRVSVQNASLTLGGGSVNYQGGIAFNPIAPNGRLVIRDVRPNKKTDSAVNAAFMLSGYNGDINIFADTVSLGTVELQGVNADFLRTRTGYNWNASALRFIPGPAGVHISNIDAGGTIDTRAKNLEANIALNAVSVADVLGILDLAVDTKKSYANVLANNVFFTTEIFFNTDFEHFAYSIPHLVIALQGRRGGFAVSSISGTDQFFELNSSRFVWKNGSMDMLARADFANKNDITFNVDFSLHNIAYYLNGAILDKSDLRVSGSYGLEMSASLHNGGAAGFIKMENFPLPTGSEMSALTFDAGFRYAGIDQWTFDVNRLELTGGGALMSANTLRVRGTVNQDGALFPDIFFGKNESALYGDGSFIWDTLPLPARLSGRLSLNNAALSERFVVDCRYESGELAVRADMFNFQSDWVYDSPLNAVLSGSFAFRHKPPPAADTLAVAEQAPAAEEAPAPADEAAAPSRWELNFDIYSLTMNLAGAPAQVKTRGSFNQYSFTAGETAITFSQVQARIPAISLNLAAGELKTEITAEGFAVDRPLRFNGWASARFEPADSWFAFSRILTALSGEIRMETFTFGSARAEKPFSFVFEKSGAVFSASGGPENMLKTRIDGDGNLFIALSKPSPVRGAVFGFIRGGLLDVESSGLYIDLGSLWEFVPLEVIQFTGGIVSADIRIQGPADDPLFYGQASGGDVRFNLPQYLSAAAGPAPVTLNFNGAEMTIEPVVIPSGGGEARVSGVFQFDHWIPRTFTLNIDSPQEYPLPFGVDVAGINAKGLAAGHLTIVLEEGSITIAGKLLGDNAEITLDSGRFGFSARETRAADSALEVITALTIRTGRKVMFLWPNSFMPLLQATAAAGDEITLTSNSLSGQFSLKGAISLRGGEMSYFKRSFYLRSGSLSFNENESQFDPRLSIRAEMRDRTVDGPVTISMIIENQSLLSFTPRLESTPALSQVEILSLLGENFSGSKDTDDQIQSPFTSSAVDLFSQIILVRRFENFMRDKVLHVDMFSMRAPIVQNYLYLTNRPEDQQTQLRVGNLFDNTSLFIGKYIGSDMFAQVMLNMRYDENRAQFQGLTLEPEFNLEFNTPLFVIQWQMRVNNLEYLWTQPAAIKDLWIPNNAISIVKHWTLP